MESDLFSCLHDSILETVISCLHSTLHLISFSLTCQRMNHLAAPILQFRKRFKTLSVAFTRAGTLLSIGELPPSEFHDILNRSKLSHCIHSACVFLDSLTASIADPPLNWLYLLPQAEELGLLAPIVHEDFFFREWKHSKVHLEMLRDGLRDGDVEARAAVFLLMLSNLQKLEVYHNQYDGGAWINWMIGKIVSSDLSRAPKESHGFLSLREVRVAPCRWSSPIDSISLNTLATFLLLPSLEKIFGFYIMHQTGEFYWDGEFGISSVKEIHFLNSFVDSADVFGEFLRIPRALIEFSFNDARDIELTSMDYSPTLGSVYQDNESIMRVDYEQIRRVVTQTLPALPLSNIKLRDVSSPI